MTRIPEITRKEQLPPEAHSAFDQVVSVYNGRVVGPFRVLFHSPELARRACTIGAFLRLDSPLSHAIRELAVIAVARELDCHYEWMAHENGARRAGVREEAIEAVRNGKMEGLNPEEALVVGFVHELLRRNRVSETTFNSLLARLGAQGLTELTGTIGFYRFFACALNAFEVPPDTPINLPPVARQS